MTAVHQFIPSLAARDAIGAHTLQVQSVLREMGLSSEIFAGDVHSELAGRARPYRSFARHRGRGEAWILYQASIGSPVADVFTALPEPKLVNYHNMTPVRMLEGWEPGVAEEVAVGRRQLTRMAGAVTRAIAVSRYNDEDLRRAGYTTTSVVPPLVDVGSLASVTDPDADERLAAVKAERGGADLLFVGRVLPHKAHHDLIKALWAYRRLYDPAARLHLVGAVGSPSYRRALGELATELGLASAVSFEGSVAQERLASHYRLADAFVCCSDHEGFCFPLLEAMQNRLPIVAYASAAVPETLGGAGILLPRKSPLEVAAAVHRVVEDPELRQALADAGEDRLGDFALSRSRAEFASLIEAVVGA